MTCSTEQVKQFTIKLHSPEEKEQFLIRKQMHELIEQTWQDDVDGIHDVKKFQELKKLANKLKG